MGFRFRTPKLVVPMRLSAFNKGNLHNVVYVLADKPVKIDSVPEEYVVRQIPGTEVFRNVTGPLPLRVLGGTKDMIQKRQFGYLKMRRNPEPHNGAAKELFAADLLAVKAGRLTHPHEEAEKMLLSIGEELGLRGQQIDKLNEAALSVQRTKTVSKSLSMLKGEMTLSVIDGNFPRKVIADRNLSFSAYKMPARRNSSLFYDAIQKAPGAKKTGALIFDAISSTQPARTNVASAGPGLMFGFAALGFVCLGIVIIRRRPALMIGMALVIGSGSTAFAQKDDDKKPVDYPKSSTEDLIEMLGKRDHAASAAKELIKRGDKVVDDLTAEAVEGANLPLRGWAIVCIARIGGDSAEKTLVRIQDDAKQPMLVRTWAAAGRVEMAKTSEDLMKLASLIPKFPALGRPVGMKLIKRLKEKGKDVTAEEMLAVTMRVPQLQQSLAPAILAMGRDKLVKAMATAKDQNVRRTAAAYVGTLFNQGDKKVPEAVVAVYKFDKNAKDIPWKGGPLFLPGINWEYKHADPLCENLVKWHLWLDIKKRNGEKAPIHNNLRSLGLARAAKYQSPGFRSVGTLAWLRTWKQARSNDVLKKILEEQGVADKEPYKGLLD